MANNRIKRYIGAFVLGTVLVAVPSCTDTWDDHYDSDQVSGATGTLWDVIKDNPKYSRFANIAQNAKFYKDNTHSVSTYTYADILNSGQVNTVWVPDNSALTEEEYQKWMAMLAESRADAENSTEAGYNVQQQFLGNHIALFRHNISEPGVDTVKMINGKNLVFDKGLRTLEGVPLGDEYNIPTVNGVMHVLKGTAPFHYNFYEYLKFSETPTELGTYVVKRDTTVFMRDLSIEGLPDENGNPTYVDSVYVTSNRLFYSTRYLPSEEEEKWWMAEKGFGAPINNEDSVFVMLMLDDASWNATFTKLEDSYNYAKVYDDKTKGDLGTKTKRDLSTDLPAGTSVEEVLDSLKKQSIYMDMVSPLVFNLHKQPKMGSELWKIETFQNGKSFFDGPENSDISENIDRYLLNTYGDTLRAIGEWKPSTLFNGEVVEMSNGLGYMVNSWNFPTQYYTPDVEVEIESSGMFYNTSGTKYKVGPASRRYSFSNKTYKEISERYGSVSNNNFYHFDASGPTTGPKVEIKLKGNSPNAYVPNAEVMSGKYDIQVVVVPHWYVNIARMGQIPSSFYVWEPVVDPDADPEDESNITYEVTDQLDFEYIEQVLAPTNKYKFKATLSYNNNSATDKTQASKNIEYSGLKVDTLTVIENFTFPYSYKNLLFSYPTLYLVGVTSKYDAKNGFVYDFVIDKIILKRKD